MRSTRIVAVAAGFVLMAGLTACGGGTSSTGGGGGDKSVPPVQRALAALQDALDRTGQEDSAKVEGTTVNDTAAGTAKVDNEGKMDWSDGIRAAMTVTQSGGTVKGTPIDGKPLPALYTPDAMYVNLGDAFAADAGGKHWMKYGWDDLADAAGASGAFLRDQMENNNPARSVQVIIASGKVKKAGTDKVRGVSATRYTGTVKVSDIARMQSKDLTEKDLAELQKQLEQNGIETETIDLWIDKNDLLVKKREYAPTAQGSYDSTVYYSDYGVFVTVQEPPASDTMDFADALSQQQS